MLFERGIIHAGHPGARAEFSRQGTPSKQGISFWGNTGTFEARQQRGVVLRERGVVQAGHPGALQV